MDEINWSAVGPKIFEALKKCRDELRFLEGGSIGGVPNAIAALIPEAIAAADEAMLKARQEGNA